MDNGYGASEAGGWVDGSPVRGGEVGVVNIVGSTT
jgi:hypothetical protein